jgi:tetratricopeptide (TPR) repeat protein
LQADHLWCAKTRARALIRLGRLREALLAARQALALDPDDALSHTIMGWALLESRDARLALPHFHTALRLSPDSSWALEGAMRARKERALFFRAVVAPIKRFVELPDWALWTLLVACWFGAHLTPRTISAYPSWKAPVVALLVIYLLLHLIRRAADPLLNVLVRSYRFTGGNTAVWSCPLSWTLTESLYMASLTFLPLSLIWRPGVVLSYIADFAFLLALAADAGKIITGQRSIHPAALIPVGTLMLILASLRG